MAPHCCQASNSRTEWALSIFLQQEEITYTTKRCRSWLIFSAKNHGNRYWSGFSGCWIGGLEGSICQGSSVTQSRLTHCNPMDCSTPGFPVHHQLPEFTQNSCPPVSDAFQPSPPLLSPSPPAFNLSQHQGLFQWVSSSYQVAKVLEFQLQHQSFQWIFRTDFLYNGLVGSPCLVMRNKSLWWISSLALHYCWLILLIYSQCSRELFSQFYKY